MVDWHSPTQLAHDAQALSNLIHVFFGIYLWEICVSLGFDLSFISGKRKFRWPLIFYFIGRYCMLGTLIATRVFIISFNTKSELDCQALWTFVQCTGNLAIGMASLNLSLRTMAVWGMKWYIVGPLVAICLGQWSLLLHGILATAKWVPGEGCVIISTDSKILDASTIYTMSFDFIVLLLTASKLAWPSTPSIPRSRLVHMLCADGLYYFLIAFLAHLIATVFMTLNLNAVMSIIGNGPAAVVATTAASRVIRHLANYSASVETFSMPANTVRQTFGQTFARPHTGVHVQMETIRLSAPATDGADGSVVKVGGVQQTSDEFKHEHYAV